MKVYAGLFDIISLLFFKWGTGVIFYACVWVIYSFIEAYWKKNSESSVKVIC